MLAQQSRDIINHLSLVLTPQTSHCRLSLNGVSNEKFGGSKVYTNIWDWSGTVVIDVYFSFEPAVFP